MKMEYDITKMVEEIAMQAKENQEEFIIETIRPYCENILQMKINKEELKQILLKGMQKQQPCENFISREETLKAFAEKCGAECGCCVYNGSGHDSAENCKLIKSMPSVTLKAKWILVSERLPEENIHVLCQFYMGGMAECYHAHNYWHIVGGYRIKIDEVIAWMPLPQPYMVESEEE